MIWRRLLYLIRRNKLDRELVEEMTAHREMMNEPKQFGSVARLREESSDVWGWRWLDEIRQDLRHGFRVFKRSPSFTLTAITVLALGIGLNLGFFQLLNAALLQPLRIRNPETLVRLRQMAQGFDSSGVAFPVTQFVKENNSVLSSVITSQTERTGWGEDASEIDANFVSSNYFEELGGLPLLGRVFHEGEDDRSGAAPVVVLSYQFWQSRMGANPGVIGSRARVNGRVATIIGVTESSFHGPRNNRAHVWVPVEQTELFYPGSRFRSDWKSTGVDMYGRLKPGVTVSAAQDAIRSVMASLVDRLPEGIRKDPWLAATSGAAHFRPPRENREISAIIVLISSLCLIVLVVTCANLSSLMVAHANARAREFQMRAALGAGRLRVLRQFVTECALLVSAGLVVGWFVGYGAARWIAVETDAPLAISLMPDWRLAVAALSGACVALLTVGLIPAWRSISTQQLTINRSPRTGFQRVLIGVQVMGSCVLLLVAAAMTRKLQSMSETDLGFEINKIAVMEVALERYGMESDAAANYWRALRESVNANQAAQGVALSVFAPLGRGSSSSVYADSPGLTVTDMTVDADFFKLLRIPLLTGRTFESSDTRETAIIVSRSLAERMYGSLEVLGKNFPKSGEGQRATIIGITEDAKLMRITATNGAESYRPLTPSDLSGARLLAKVENLNVLRTAAHAVNPAILPSLRWMHGDLEDKLQAPRLARTAAGFVGLLALSLTSIGIFGLIAYTVSLKTREIGIRMALGAQSQSVLWLLLRGLAWPVAIGAGVGALVVFFGLAKPLAGDPLYADPSDPMTVVVSLAVLVAAGMIAGCVPAVRALRIDPSRALRED